MSRLPGATAIVVSLMQLAVTAQASSAQAGAATAPRQCEHLPVPTAPEAQFNDNDRAAGDLRDGVLTVRLVAMRVTWRPDGPEGCAVEMNAFGEEGRAAEIPAPLIRVPVGTELRILVRNALTDSIVVRGLHDHTVDSLVPTEVAPGAGGEIRFRATAPGTFWYTGTPARRAQPFESNAFGQLAGAFVVDSAGQAPADRIFVLTRWAGGSGGRTVTGYELNAVNGRSWPNTERLSVTVGDTARWRVISVAGGVPHTMHLHGFYFAVTSRGDGIRDTVYTTEQRPSVVTESLQGGGTFTLEWIPQRAGNWIFHCHLVDHTHIDQRLDRMPAAQVDTVGATTAGATHDDGHAQTSMAGLVLGITAEPRAGAPEAPAAVPPIRTLRLFANQRPRAFGDQPGFGFVLQEGAAAPAADSIRWPGTPIVLTRGEPAQITVFNRLSSPLAVHWHGIELESYFDGVAGWSGAPDRIAPAIQPGDSFVVRMTPPRAGTFMYHIHNEHQEELGSGLYGPLLVMEPGRTFDPQTDHVFLISDSGPDQHFLDGVPVFVNGSLAPEPQDWTPGISHRIRVIHITSSNSVAAVLAGAADPPANAARAATPLEDALRQRLAGRGLRPVEWRAIAVDGADLPARRAAFQPAMLVMRGPGMTFDFEYTPTTGEPLTFEVYTPTLRGPALEWNGPTSAAIRIVERE